jgi:hypothetical protein
MDEAWREQLKSTMSVTSLAMIGQSIDRVCYFEVGHEYVDVFADVCDVCDYGIAFETSGGMRLNVVRLNWLSGNESALYLGPGHVVDNYNPETYGPFREVDVSTQPRWAPFIGRPMTNVSYFGLDWTDRRPIAPEQFDAYLRPYDMRIDFEGADSVFIYSGNYQPAYGFERNEWFSLVVAFGPQQNEHLLRRVIR